METKNTLYNSALKTGLIIGVVSIVVFLVEYVADIKPVGIMMPFVVLLIGLAINITILVIYFKKYRALIGGYISFLDSFLYCLVALVSASVISSVFSLIFLQFIDPEYLKNIMEAQKAYMENYLAGKMSEEQLAATLDGIEQEAAKMTPVSQTIKTLIGSIIFSGIVALIVGAILKKKPELFEDNAGGTI